MELKNVQWKSGKKSEPHTEAVNVTLCPTATSLTDCCSIKLWLKEMFVTFCWWTVLTWQHSSALCYCTVFSVFLWMWQSVCSSYCCQLNAVSFSTALHATLYRSIYSLLTWSSLGTLQGFLVCYCKCGSPSVPVIAVSWMLSVSAQHFMLHCTDPYTVCSLGPLQVHGRDF